MTSHNFTKLTTISAVTLALAGLIAGCASGNAPAPVAALSGRVQSGPQAVSGATIQLYAVGNTGNASAATPLLTAPVKTDSNGGFVITGLWTCSNTSLYGNDPLLYLTASGGNAGLAAGTNNNALVMMTAIGRCSTLTSSSFTYVNEVATVSAAYALAPFMADATHVGASTAFMPGLSNAFATVSTLVNSTTGVSPGPGAVSGIAVPSNEINSLANSIAPCVNSDGTTACTSLFAATTPANGSAPTNTLGALLNIAGAPSRNVGGVYALGAGLGLYQPQLASAPNDWTIALTFSGSGLQGPQGVAIDPNSNAWIANASGTGVTGLSNQGLPLAGAAPYTAGNTIYGAQAVAVDRTGSVWVADTLLSSVVKLSLTNSQVTGASTFTSGLSGPTAIAIDGGNRVWLTNFGSGSITELSNSGSLMNGSPISQSGLQVPAGVAVDSSGNAWVTDNLSSLIFEFDKNGKPVTLTGYSDGGLIAPVGIAIDSTSRVWVADGGDAAVSLFSASGSPAIPTPVVGAGLAIPTVVAIDGAGAAWIANTGTNGSITKISANANNSVGGLGLLNLPAGEAIDSSGNLWVTNSGDNTVSKFVGLASPVLTPLTINLPSLP